jgi:parallel beta-helix repeat protein
MLTSQIGKLVVQTETFGGGDPYMNFKVLISIVFAAMIAIAGCSDDTTNGGGSGGSAGTGGSTGICDTSFGGFPAADCENLPDLTSYSIGNYWEVPATSDVCTVTFEDGEMNSNRLNAILDGADPGDTICIATGTYTMEATVTIAAVPGLTLKGIGASPDDTILNFGGPGTGKGILVQQDNVTIENMWVKNTGDNSVQQEEVTGSVFRKLHVSWDDFCEGPGARENCGESCNCEGPFAPANCGEACSLKACDEASDNTGAACTMDSECPNGECVDQEDPCGDLRLACEDELCVPNPNTYCDDPALICGEGDACVGNMSADGAYALYPTDCHATLVEYNQLQGASDAGIYVGKCGWGDDTTEGGLVQYNLVHENVLGLEVENSLDVVVHDNIMVNNTAGLLSLQQPISPEKPSNSNIVWYNNNSYCNNHPNFAATGVAQIAPPGSGAIVYSGDGQELCNNRFENNVTGGILIISNYLVCQLDPPTDCNRPTGYVPYALNIYTHDNYFSSNGTDPQGEFAPLFLALGIGTPENPIEDVFWDGYIYPDAPDGNPGICLGTDNTASYRDMTNNACQDEPSGDLGAVVGCAITHTITDTAGRLCDGPL